MRQCGGTRAVESGDSGAFVFPLPRQSVWPTIEPGDGVMERWGRCRTGADMPAADFPQERALVKNKKEANTWCSECH
jgi:hypothetical protein